VAALAHGTARKIIDPAGGWQLLRSSPAGPDLLAIWDERADALTAYRDRLRALGDTLPVHIMPSLLHMHHNRLLGIDRTNEERVTALAGAVLGAHTRRREADQ
jgi:thiopeptide-type bacteriocin biosynthesis protein